MRTTPVSVAEAVRSIVASQTPVLFLDTCALLDIVRLPFRARSTGDSENLLTAAISILDKAREDQLSLVIPPPVPIELQNNLSSVEQEARNAVEELRLRYNVLTSIQKAAGKPASSLVIEADGIITFLKDLTTQLIVSSTELSRDDELDNRILTRIANNRPPSSKGAVNDCIVYEHTLQLMRNIRDAGHRQSLVFLTSNTNDYCISRAPKEPIRAELDSVDARLCTTWNWALNELGLTERSAGE